MASSGTEQKAIPFDSLFADLPVDPSKRLDALVEVQHAFRRALAAQLQPIVRTMLQESPPTTSEARLELAPRLNHVLRDAGLAIADPESGKPTTLAADAYRVRLQTRLATSTRQTFSGNVKDLPPLELIECQRQEPIRTWRERSSSDEPGKKNR